MPAPALSLMAWDGRLDVETAHGLRARVYFDALQDRHVPITPRLAQALAQLERARDSAVVVPWGRAYDHAGRALGLGGTFGRTEFWATLTPVFVMEIAEPLLRKASVSCGEVPVTMPGATRSAPDFEAKFRKIETALVSLLATPEVAGLGFWSRAGMAMLAAYQDRITATGGGAQRSPGGPQRVSRVVPGLVFELEPERTPALQQEKRKLRPSVRSERLRAGIRPREGGVDGIAHSRRIDEVDAALTTTFAYPRDLLLLKLLEEGFLTTLRPPFRHPSRDLLSLALAKGSAAQGPAALVKAAWVDASIRLGLILARLGRARSELGWCDLLDEGPACAAFSVQSQQDRQPLDGWALSGVLRLSMISRSTLTPAAFAATPARPWRSGVDENRTREAVQTLLVESGRVAHGFGTLKDATNRRQTASSAAKPAEYSVVLAIDIATGQDKSAQRITDWPADRAAIARKVDLPSLNKLRAGQVLLPRELGFQAVFRVASDVEPAERVLQANSEHNHQEALQSLLGQLSDWFVEQTLCALDD